MGYFFWCFVNTEKLLILIPAIKKNVAFEDDLVKKIAGVSLLQRSINLAKSLDIDSCDIFILTDSEEIALIANRNNVECYIDSKLIWPNRYFWHQPTLHVLHTVDHWNRKQKKKRKTSLLPRHTDIRANCVGILFQDGKNVLFSSF